MKKMVVLIALLAALLSLGAMVYAHNDFGLVPYHDAWGEGNGGGTVHYIRTDTKCENMPNREKTTCEMGGRQLCEPRYCNQVYTLDGCRG